MKRIAQAALLLLVLVLSASSAATAAEKQYRHDVLVVGAGIADFPRSGSSRKKTSMSP
jgi:putative cell wall-binding protein